MAVAAVAATMLLVGAGPVKQKTGPASTPSLAATTGTSGAIGGAMPAPAETPIRIAQAKAPHAAKISAPAKGETLPEIELVVTPETTVNGGVALAVVKGLVAGDSVTGTFSGQAIPFHAAEGKATALVGVDINVAHGKKYSVTVKVMRGGKAITKKKLIAIEDGRYPEEKFEVPKEKDSGEDPKLLARIKSDQRALAKFWPIWTGERLWAGNFVKPVSGEVSSLFGRRRVINGVPRLPHSGLDLRGATGTPIVSPAAGRVVYVGDQFFSGNVTLVDHGHGVYSMFAHQSKVTVSEGQLVAAGEKVGEVGATGRVTGPHCHWGLRVNGARVDPLKLMEVDLSETALVVSTAGAMTTGTAGP